MIDLHSDIDISSLPESEAKKKIDNINLVADHFRLIKYYTDSKYCADNALEMSEAIQYTEGIATAKNNLGMISYDTGDFASAIEQLTSSAKLFNMLNTKQVEAKVYSHLGICYRHIDDYATMIDILFRALYIYRDIADEIGEGTILNSIGGYYLEIRQEELALEYYGKSLKLKGKQKDIDGCIRILYNKGLIFFNLRQYEKSLKYYSEALNFNRKIEQSAFLENRILQNIAQVHKHTGQYEKAVKINLECIDYFYKTNNHPDTCDSLRVLAGLYVKMGEFELAGKNFKEAEDLAKSLNSKRLQMLVHSEIHEYYVAINDFKNALISIEKFQELNHERNITIEEENIRKLNILHTVDVTKKETQILTEKNEELKRLNNELVRLNDEKDFFLDLAGSDLKQPLEKINDCTFLVKKNGKLNSVENLTLIIEESSNMQKIISKLLSINEKETTNL